VSLVYYNVWFLDPVHLGART